MKPLLAISDLKVDFSTRAGTVEAVKGVDISVHADETLAIVGESGSGKSVTAYSVLGLLGRRDVSVIGSIRYEDKELLTSAYPDSCQAVRGRKIAMIFQNPQEGLNPTRTVGQQLCDILRAHYPMGKAEGRARAIELLNEVKIANAVDRYAAHPHELSGGMCQRVMIAIALACEPSLLIADEPTTGLDVTTQKLIMELLQEKRAERRMATMIITHDLALAAMYADRIVVMEAGKVVESGKPDALFSRPREAYTRKLIEATPRPHMSIGQLSGDGGVTAQPDAISQDAPILLALDGVTKEYPIPTEGDPYRMVPVVKDVSFSVHRGECIGIVGESGSGKSTLGRMICRLIDPTSGAINFDGTEIAAMPSHAFSRSPLRKDIQFVFQNASLSLNPRWSIAQTITDALKRLGISRDSSERAGRAREVADQVGLPKELLGRFPHQLSGGQKARAGIGRAIAPHPRLLILDEPTTALDVSVQAVVLKELQRLIEELSLTVLFISHDLNVVRMLCDRVVVLKSGEIVESGSTAELFDNPSSDYVAELIAAIPRPPAEIDESA